MADLEETVADLVRRLQDIAGELDDLAFEALREAAAGGDLGHVATERRLAKARRAVSRAAAALRPGDGSDLAD